MDKEPEELQFLGFFGICHEACKLICSCRKLFSQITLTLVLPLSFLFLLHIEISNLIFSNIDRNASENAILSRISSEWTTFLVFKGVYLLFVLVFSLLSTSAIVYTIACVYTAKDVSFRKVITVVPKVWKRLMVTFLWSFSILFIYNFFFILLLLLVLIILGTGPVGAPIALLSALLYFVGLVYISIIWHLASVISVLEDTFGIAAMEKSKSLIRGRVRVVVSLFLVFQIVFVGMEVAFGKLVVHGEQSGLGVGVRVALAAAILLVLNTVVLVALVVQTVVYFVCKSYHHESIDKSSLSNHLEVYLGEYVPLREKDLQLEQFHV